MKKEYFLPLSILLAALIIAVAIIYNVGSKSPNSGPSAGEATNSLDLTDNDVVLGKIDAPVTIIEYSDFQCPFCGQFFVELEPLIREDYVATGKAKFVYRHFAFLGSESKSSAEASECAKDEGKFWKFHDFLFNHELKDGTENNGNLNRGLFLSIAKDLSLNESQFASCLDNKKYSQKVNNDYFSGQKVVVTGTPTLFINNQKITGIRSYPEIKAIINQELAK